MDRILELVSKFAAQVTQESGETRFLDYLLHVWTFPKLGVENNNVRLNCSKLLWKVVANTNLVLLQEEILDELLDNLLTRSLDKLPRVREAAIGAMGYLEDISDKAFLIAQQFIDILQEEKTL